MFAPLLMLLQPAAADPAFRPPTDTALIVETRRVQTEAAAQSVFTATRRIRFAREQGGYAATVTVISVEGQSPGDAGALFEAGYGFLLGRSVTVHLDAAGNVVSVDNLDMLWRDLCASLAERFVAARGIADSERRDRMVAQVAAALRAWPEDRRRAAFASMVTDIVAPDALPRAGTSEPVRVPGHAPDGERIILTGTAATRAQGPLLYVLTEASGEQAGERPVRIARSEELVFDPATGLIRRHVERSRTEIGIGGDRDILEYETTISVAAES
ncbi:hypothetical protein [Stakelama tenebrarum]|uniref:Uncharacterized protein n=1 Tax=Stakelama tenebrarum TaxID=2711215 RepID=A0A6G6Y3Y8_9SPHN|nr:hypothetical protein [Sphingosinithalassobacter tenebrarum]QIG79609.1 hypothetical protein G5C33_07270 [Sphingosinithalassobacter tenebrarum]